MISVSDKLSLKCLSEKHIQIYVYISTDIILSILLYIILNMAWFIFFLWIFFHIRTYRLSHGIEIFCIGSILVFIIMW